MIAETIVGLVYVLLSTIFIASTTVFNLILMSDEELMRMEAYRVLLHIGVQNTVQLFAHLCGGIFTLSHSTFHLLLNKVVGGILNASWITMTCLVFALALSQFSVICNGIYRLKSNIWLQNFMSANILHIGFAYGAGALFLIVFLTPWSGVIYLLDSFCFSYDGVSPSNEVVSEIDWFCTITINSLSFIVYLSIFIMIVQKRRAHHLEFNRKELRVLLHSFILYVWVLFIIFAFHDYSLLLPPSEWTFFAISTIWILYCGLSPMLYIVFNRTVRKKIVDKYFRNGAGRLFAASQRMVTNFSAKRITSTIQHY